jgi:hypothetical protein
MKEWIEKNFKIILVVFLVLAQFKGCRDSRKLNDINEYLSISQEKTKQLIVLEGLKSEKRMIEATDRKILDVNRSNQIDIEIKKIEEKIKNNDEKLDK